MAKRRPLKGYLVLGKRNPFVERGIPFWTNRGLSKWVSRESAERQKVMTESLLNSEGADRHSPEEVVS